jgi:hypothetical protein
MAPPLRMFLQKQQQPSISIRKIKRPNLISRNPGQVEAGDGFGFPFHTLASEKLQTHCLLGIGVRDIFDFFPNIDVDAQFLMNFPRQAFFETFVHFPLAAGKLPKPTKMIIQAALRNKQFASAKNERGCHVDGWEFSGRTR